MPTTTEEQQIYSCADCQEQVTSNDYLDNNGEVICESCNDDYFTCDGCSDTCHTDYLNSANDSCYCNDCYTDRYTSCDDCGDYERNDDTTTVYGSNGRQRVVCHDCRDDNYGWCDPCDEYVHEDNYHSDNMCNGCYDDRHGYDDEDSSGNESSIINGYGYKPRPTFFKMSDKDDVFLGIELEVERGDSSIRHVPMAEMINHDFLYFKTDGSLNDGFEIVTHPMTISYIKQNKNVWADILNQLRSNKYRSYDTKTCGMHIHVSKNAFTTWHLYRFMKFFVDNSDFITKISQRKIENLDRWAALTDNPSESYKEYSEEQLMYKAKKKSGNSKRYLAVNLQNDKSVEIRIFRGTLNDSSFFKNIEFVQALFDYTKSVPDKDMGLQSFLTFIKDNNEYPYLRKFIADKNLNPIFINPKN
jgi:hypothetical protein